jgi:hypothetical protein
MAARRLSTGLAARIEPPRLTAGGFFFDRI